MRHTPLAEIAAKPLATSNKKETIASYKSPSLKTLLEPEKKKTDSTGVIIEEDKSSEKTSFTEEILIKVWNEYRSLIKKDSNKTSLYSAVSANPPKKLDEINTSIDVYSPIQVAQINENKAEILEYVKNKLQNDFIELEVVLVKNQNEDTKMLYTDRDKFEVMKEKNEAIDYMRLKFNLDIEF